MQASHSDHPFPEFTWIQYIREVYPRLAEETYFFPPLHFNRVPHRLHPLAGEPVLVYENPLGGADPSGTPPPPGGSSRRRRRKKNNMRRLEKRRHHPYRNVQVAGQLFPAVSISQEEGQPLGLTVHEGDRQSDAALQRVLHCLGRLADSEREVMMVVSQLRFQNYLSEAGLSVEEAQPIALLPSLDKAKRDESDVLVLHRTHGLLVGEIKSVGGNEHFLQSNDTAQSSKILERLKTAVKQLGSQRTELNKVVSDLGVKVTLTIILPNITSGQLKKALCSQEACPFQKELFECLQAENITDALNRCLCADHLDSASTWWRHLVPVNEPDPSMNALVYERLVARFCGPATAVEIPTVSSPNKVVRTRGQAVAETGLSVSTLALYPQQVCILSEHDEDSVFLWGPPGTGKTVLLYLQAKQWAMRGQDVYLLSLGRWSQSVTMLLESQLRSCLCSLTSDMRRLASSSTQADPVHHTNPSEEEKADRPGINVNLVHRPAASAHLSSTSAFTTSARAPFSKCPPSVEQQGTAMTNVYRYQLDLDSETGTDVVQKAANQLAGLTAGRCLHLIVDEVDVTSSDHFLALCRALYRSTGGTVRMWAAGLYRPSPLPDWLVLQPLTHNLRSPPVVQREVAKSRSVDDGLIPRYSTPPVPPHTEGPPVRWLKHKGQPGHEDVELTSTGGQLRWGDPRDCCLCGENVYEQLMELGVEAAGSGLQWRDVLILSGSPDPSKTAGLMNTLRAHGVPIFLIRDGAQEGAVKAATLALRNEVLGAGYRTMSGLERRVVVGMGWAEGLDRLRAMSRCTSQLIWIDEPNPV